MQYAMILLGDCTYCSGQRSKRLQMLGVTQEDRSLQRTPFGHTRLRTRWMCVLLGLGPSRLSTSTVDCRRAKLGAALPPCAPAREGPAAAAAAPPPRLAAPTPTPTEVSEWSMSRSARSSEPPDREMLPLLRPFAVGRMTPPLPPRSVALRRPAAIAGAGAARTGKGSGVVIAANVKAVSF